MDCPGHASLIRTIIGGAQIIDLMLLVVDVTKGIQVSPAACQPPCTRDTVCASQPGSLARHADRPVVLVRL